MHDEWRETTEGGIWKNRRNGLYLYARPNLNPEPETIPKHARQRENFAVATILLSSLNLAPRRQNTQIKKKTRKRQIFHFQSTLTAGNVI
jgi:hypothetical protein